GFRVLAHGQLADRTQAEHEDQQADHDCQHRLLDEQVGEFHSLAPAGADGWFGAGAVTARPEGRADRSRRASGWRPDARACGDAAALPHCSCGVGFSSFFGSRELSIVSGVPFFSLSWPLVTTSIPSSMPDSTAIWSPRVGPVVTNTCCAVGGAGLPSAPLPSPGWTTITVSPYGLNVIAVCGRVRRRASSPTSMPMLANMPGISTPSLLSNEASTRALRVS